MQIHARATADRQDVRPSQQRQQRREGLVSGAAVASVAVAAVLAAVMHTGVGRSGAGALQAACAECGVVEAVRPLPSQAAASGSAWELRVRMDDGSLRTVRQRGVLAEGSRVTMAGGSVRLLPGRPGRG